MKKTVKTLVILILIAAICVSGYNIYKISDQYTQEARVKRSLQKYRPNVKSPDNFGEKTDGSGEVINLRVIELQNEVNSDIIGWLTIPGTRIDYPFVIAGDNSYYLQRDVYGDYSAAGTLFMDYRCARDFSGFNNIIYGHNMKSNSMFGDLALFADRDFFEAHPSGTILLCDRTYTLDFFAYIIVDADDSLIYSISEPEDALLEYISAMAHNYREPVTNEKIVVLSTCSYAYDGARIILIGSCM